MCNNQVSGPTALTCLALSVFHAHRKRVPFKAKKLIEKFRADGASNHALWLETRLTHVETASRVVFDLEKLSIDDLKLYLVSLEEYFVSFPLGLKLRVMGRIAAQHLSDGDFEAFVELVRPWSYRDEEPEEVNMQEPKLRSIIQQAEAQDNQDGETDSSDVDMPASVASPPASVAGTEVAEPARRPSWKAGKCCENSIAA
jgi:hypothetical protein